MQITAELDNQHLKKLQLLEKLLKKSTSELIEFAIDEIFVKTAALLPNEQTESAMLDVRAKRNLQNITLEQLQHEIDVQ